jgi:pyruvate dehydrogenase E2 component (dihydrolipoyllysine-residue acetyltransferase)
MAQPITMPKMGADMAEGTLINWLKKVGDPIKEGEVIAEVDADKATVEVPATASGTILSLVGEPGQALQVGSVIAYVGQPGEKAEGGTAASSAADAAPALKSAVQAAPAPAPSAAPQQVAPVPQPKAELNGEHLPDGVRASPIARKIAADKGIDLRQVTGTGPNGRIQKSDVETYTPAAPAPVQARAAGIPAPSYGNIPSGPDVEVIDVTRLRDRIAKRMTESKQQVPHFYVTTEIDVEPMLELRKQLNSSQDEAHKISVNDLIVKATALTLRQFPNLNSHYYGSKVVRYKRINIGIAVALEKGGLMNVVSPDADKVALGTMAALNKERIARARDGKVKPEDIEGSTFTVSNLGPYEVEQFAAIINPPEAGILAVSSAKKVPVVKPDGTLGVGNRMKVTISVDHRVSDGAEAAQFLQAFKTLVENPMRLLI